MTDRMPSELDHTQQRIIGVLIEKELAVPESYPLTENTLIAACNQKSNRDPEMGLEQFEVNGAMNSLMAADWAKTTTSMGGHATRYAHRLESQHAVDEHEKAVLCELLIRGPQAPGALKPRVVRLGFTATPHDIEEVLRGLAARPAPLVEQQSKRPRERDHRWCHLLGPMSPAHQVDQAGSAPTPAASPDPSPAPLPVDPPEAGLQQRVEQLEADVAELRAALDRLRDS